jgi:hypothetical protein
MFRRWKSCSNSSGALSLTLWTLVWLEAELLPPALPPVSCWRRFSSLFCPPVPCQTVGGPCGYEPGCSVGVHGRRAGVEATGEGVAEVCTGGGLWRPAGPGMVCWRGGLPMRNGGVSAVAVAGVSGGGGEPLRPAVVEVDVIRLGGGQYC